MQRHPRLSALAIALASLAAGCGGRSTFDFVFDDSAAPVDPPVDPCGAPSGTCATRACDPPLAEANHVPLCSDLAYATNPPTSGPHYPIWGLFKTYEQPLARGFYLHDAEHSAIVLLYNCAFAGSECEALRASLEAFANSRPQDPLCEAPTRNRVIVTPDPLLDVPFAAVAWGHSLKADCFDEAAVTAFVDAYYGKNYENFCSGGIDPTDPASGIESGCGF